MVWCAESMIHDRVPVSRMSRSWVLSGLVVTAVPPYASI